MRFTTWSTLINAFVISTVTVALLSLISAADALYIHITEPGSSGEIVLVNSTETFEWSTIPPNQDVSYVYGKLILMNVNGYNYILNPNVAAKDLKITLKIPYVALGPFYYIKFRTNVGDFYGDLFEIA